MLLTIHLHFCELYDLFQRSTTGLRTFLKTFFEYILDVCIILYESTSKENYSLCASKHDIRTFMEAFFSANCFYVRSVAIFRFSTIAVWIGTEGLPHLPL